MSGRTKLPTARDVERALKRGANKNQARLLARFFKTGKGEYAEGDKFLGVMVPATRHVVNAYAALPEVAIAQLLASPYHEVRLAGLLILVRQYETGDARARRRIAAYYLRHLGAVNNWDLVDLTAHKILGEHLQGKSLIPLERLARSRHMWHRRVAIIATFAHLRRGNYQPTLCIAKMLLGDKEDLIHKAVGWALREVGKRCGTHSEETFLRAHYAELPRTALRYAIERFPEQKWKAYLRGSMAKRAE